MEILLLIINSLKKILKFIKDSILKILIFFTNYTIKLTGDSSKIFLQSNSDLHKVIYILWGFVGFVLCCFFLFICFDFYVIQSIFFIEKPFWFKCISVLIPTLIVYNVYFFAFKTIHIPNNIFTFIPFSLIKIILISFIIFYFTFPFLYKNNLNLIEKKVEIYRNNEVVKNEFLVNRSTIIKVKDLFKNNYLSKYDNNQINEIKIDVENIIISTNLSNKISNLQKSNDNFIFYKVSLLRELAKSDFSSEPKLNSQLTELKKEFVDNEILKNDIKNKITNSNLLLNRILLVYKLDHFKLNYIIICVFFNLAFILKIFLFYGDGNYKGLTESEDEEVRNNKNFN